MNNPSGGKISEDHFFPLRFVRAILTFTSANEGSGRQVGTITVPLKKYTSLLVVKQLDHLQGEQTEQVTERDSIDADVNPLQYIHFDRYKYNYIDQKKRKKR